MRKISVAELNIKYTLILCFYWGVGCVICGGYGTVLLLGLGFRNSQVGIVIALGNLLSVLLQPTVASFADASKKISLPKISAILAAIVVAGFAALYFMQSQILAVALLFVLTFSVFNTLQSMTNAISLYYINHGYGVNYGLPRGLGSTTFAVTSTIIGQVIKVYGNQCLLWTGLILGVGLFLSIFSLPVLKLAELEESHQEKKQPTKGIGAFIQKYPRFMVFLLGTVFVFTFHGICNVYLSQMYAQVGGDASQMGIGQSVAAIMELPVMGLSALLIRKFGSRKLLRFSAICFILKAVGYMIAGNVMMLHVVQALQLGAYAVFIPVSVFYVNDIMEKEDTVKGQALTVTAITIGNILASLLGGLVIDSMGIMALEAIQIVFAVLGAVILFIIA